MKSRIKLFKDGRTDEGFTLIELLIVIIILGILAAIVVFAVGTTRKDSVTSSCKTDLKSIQLSAEAVNTKVGSYPAAAGTTSGDNLIAPASGALLKQWPTSSDYSFTYAKTTGGYTIAVGGPNVAGTAAGTPLTDTATGAQINAACLGS